MNTRFLSANKNLKNKFLTHKLLIICLALQLGINTAQSQVLEEIKPIEENVAIPNVRAQFDALRTDGEWIGATRSFSVPTTGGTSSAHYQGIIRAPYRAGNENNILYVSKSGNEEQNYVGTVRLGSSLEDPYQSASHGERFGTNLLEKGKTPEDTLTTLDFTIVDGQVVFKNSVIDAKVSSRWKHPGGMQAVGDVMAMPLEQSFNTINYRNPKTGRLQKSEGRIEFYDIRNPANPKRMSYFLDMIEAEAAMSNFELQRVKDRTGKDIVQAGVASMTKLPNGKYLLLVTYALDAVVIAFVSNDDSFFTQQSENIWVENRNFEFEFYDVWFAEEQYKASTLSTYYRWPWAKATNINNSFISSFQQISLINQTDGRIFLTGSFNASKLSPVIVKEDLVNLFELRGFPGDLNDDTGQLKINFLSSKHLHMTAGDGGRFGNANAGIGAYTSPTRELLLYGIAHFEANDMLRISEYRHRDMAFSENKVGVKFRPKHLGEPITLNIGDSFTIDASSRYIGSWADYYEDSFYNNGNGSKRILSHEAKNQGLDDYDNFGDLDKYHDKMTSLRMGLEPNIILHLFEDDSYEKGMFNYFSTFSNGNYNTLIRNSNVGNAVNDKLSSALMFDLDLLYRTFKPFYTHADTITLLRNILISRGVVLSDNDINSRRQLRKWEWDLDGNGSYETKTDSPQVTFKATNAGTYFVRVRHAGVTEDVDGKWVEKQINVLPDNILVPDFVGLPITQALNQIDSIELMLGEQSREYHAFLPIDHVSAHYPIAGELVEVDTQINLTVSLGQEGDIDLDGDIDRNDIRLIMRARNQDADEGFDRRDLDLDGKITALDMRKATLLCSRSRCATE